MLHNHPQASTAPCVLTRSADILDRLSKDIEELGASLCADPEIFMRHCEAIQQIDLIAQHQRGLAMVIRATDKTAAIEEVSVDTLRTALRG